MGLAWSIAGALWCLTIVGIPLGMQCFKFAQLAFFPFGKRVRFGGGIGSFVLNLIWIATSGALLCALAAAFGCLFCLTVVGIPLGRQCFKLAKLSLMPFGAAVIA